MGNDLRGQDLGGQGIPVPTSEVEVERPKTGVNLSSGGVNLGGRLRRVGNAVIRLCGTSGLSDGCPAARDDLP
jgi:hypothetical protein